MDAREIIDEGLVCLSPFVPLMKNGADMMDEAHRRAAERAGKQLGKSGTAHPALCRSHSRVSRLTDLEFSAHGLPQNREMTHSHHATKPRLNVDERGREPALTLV